MRMTRLPSTLKWLTCAGVLALAGCSAPAPQPIQPAPLPGSPTGTVPDLPRVDSCNATAASVEVLGKVSSPQIEQQAMRLAGATTVRTLREGQPITLEYSYGRLNLIVNAQNVITAVRCG